MLQKGRTSLRSHRLLFWPRLHVGGRALLRFVWLLQWPLYPLLLTLHGNLPARGQTAATADDLRTAMVQHLTAYVEWPPAKLDAAHPYFTICLLGANSFQSLVENAFRTRTVFSKPVLVERLTATDKVDNCHVLYIGAVNHKAFDRMVPALQQASVLTVSEHGDAQGQVVSLPFEDDHIAIQVDLQAAQASHLTISSRLLHLASLVKK